EPAGDLGGIAAPDPRGQPRLAEAVLVVARELPGHEGRSAAAPEQEPQERRGHGKEPGTRRSHALEAPAHCLEQPRPRPGRGSGAQAWAEAPLEVCLVAAREARGEVLLDAGPLVGAEDAVHVARDELGLARHDAPSASARRRSARPREMRDITVPWGIASA